MRSIFQKGEFRDSDQELSLPKELWKNIKLMSRIFLFLILF
jgi:hypothetical protein